MSFECDGPDPLPYGLTPQKQKRLPGSPEQAEGLHMPAIVAHPEEHSAPRVAVAIYANEKQPEPKRQGSIDWKRFAPRLLNHDIRPEKSGPAFGPYSLIRGGTRRNADVEALSMLVPDSDNGV